MTMDSQSALRLLSEARCIGALLQVSRPGGRIETLTYGSIFAAK